MTSSKTLGSGLMDTVRQYIHNQELENFDTLNGLYKSLQLAISVTVAFILSDLVLLYPDRTKDDFQFCLIVRLTIILTAGIFLFICHAVYEENGAELRKDASFMRHRCLLGLLVLQIIGNGTSMIAMKIDGGSSNYFSGLIMVFVGMAVLVPIRSGLLATNMAIMIVFYYICLWWDEGTWFISVNSISNITMLFGGAAVSWYGCKTMYKLRNPTAAISPPSSAIKKPRYIYDLARVAGTIVTGVLALFARMEKDRSVPEKHLSIPAINIIGVNSQDCSIECRNISSHPIMINNAQVLFGSTNRREDVIAEVKFSGQAAYHINPGATVRLYLDKPGLPGYYIDYQGQTTLEGLSKYLAKVDPKTIRLFGFHLLKRVD